MMRYLLDRNGDKRITVEDFTYYSNKVRVGNRIMVKLFNTIDTNKDGELSRHDVKMFLHLPSSSKSDSNDGDTTKAKSENPIKKCIKYFKSDKDDDKEEESKVDNNDDKKDSTTDKILTKVSLRKTDSQLEYEEEFIKPSKLNPFKKVKI
jgi:hypothetical protein